MNLSFNELILLSSVSIILFGILIINYTKRLYYEIFSPITFHVSTLIYYVVLGPLVILINNDTVLRGVDHRGFFAISWLACIVSMVALLIGFYSVRSISQRSRIKFVPLDSKVKKISLWIFFLVIIAFAIYTKGNIWGRLNFLTYKSFANIQETGTFTSYLMLSINMLIVPVLLLLILFIKKQHRLLFFTMLLITVSLYINEAFRYRLVVLVIGLVSTYCLFKQVKPNPIFLIIAFIFLATFMGFIERTRGYGRGLNVEKLNEYADKSYLKSGFNDSSVFMATGNLIENTSMKGNFTGLAFLYNAIATPIPRVLWPGKPEGQYIIREWKELYGDAGDGQAFLYYGEYFNIYGWIGVVILSFLLGMFYKTVWLFFLLNQEHPFAIVALSVFNGFIYVIVSRGYFSQQVTMFFFTVFPIFYLIGYLRKHPD